MAVAEDLIQIAVQENTLRLSTLDADAAWHLGSLARILAVERKHKIVIDIRSFGRPHQQLFFGATPGTIPDNGRWVRRKSNVVARLHRSSYAIGLGLIASGRTFRERYTLPDADYAAHGGSFPLHVAGAGIVGALTVSGLAQRDDHNLTVEALCLHLQLDPAALSLKD